MDSTKVGMIDAVYACVHVYSPWPFFVGQRKTLLATPTFWGMVVVAVFFVQSEREQEFAGRLTPPHTANLNLKKKRVDVRVNSMRVLCVVQRYHDARGRDKPREQNKVEKKKRNPFPPVVPFG